MGVIGTLRGIDFMKKVMVKTVVCCFFAIFWCEKAFSFNNVTDIENHIKNNSPFKDDWCKEGGKLADGQTKAWPSIQTACRILHNSDDFNYNLFIENVTQYKPLTQANLNYLVFWNLITDAKNKGEQIDDNKINNTSERVFNQLSNSIKGLQKELAADDIKKYWNAFALKFDNKNLSSNVDIAKEVTSKVDESKANFFYNALDDDDVIANLGVISQNVVKTYTENAKDIKSYIEWVVDGRIEGNKPNIPILTSDNLHKDSEKFEKFQREGKKLLISMTEVWVKNIEGKIKEKQTTTKSQEQIDLCNEILRYFNVFKACKDIKPKNAAFNTYNDTVANAIDTATKDKNLDTTAVKDVKTIFTRDSSLQEVDVQSTISDTMIRLGKMILETWSNKNLAENYNAEKQQVGNDRNWLCLTQEEF